MYATSLFIYSTVSTPLNFSTVQSPNPYSPHMIYSWLVQAGSGFPALYDKEIP